MRGNAIEREWKLPLCRSYLYVPTTKPELFDKALASEADAIILDLEDGVPADRKEEGREFLADLLATPPAKPIIIRVNAPRSGLAEADLEVAARLPATGMRIPKVRTADELLDICDRLRELGFLGSLQVQIECAEAVVNLREIVQADPLVETLSLGEGDLRAELGCEKSTLGSLRLEVVVVSCAFGLQRPIQAGHAELAGTEMLEATTIEGKRAGFFGRIALHPAQLEIINRAYTPCRHEVDYARDTFARLEEIWDKGQMATRDMHGKYLSGWYRPIGERVLKESELFGTVDSCPVCESKAPRPERRHS